MKLLKQLYCIYSKSRKECDMVEFIIDWLYAHLPEVEVEMDKLGNLYITKGKAALYPTIVAHLDQVQWNHSNDFRVEETDDILFGWSRKNKRFEGLGADDKNGIWVGLKCLQKFDVLKVAFFVGEEIGCVGSSDADMSFFVDSRFVLQCDRRGGGDLITIASNTELCGSDFIKDTDYELFGYKKENGMMTDVLTLKENGLSVSCVNISCGYYEPHTDREYTIKSELLNCLAFVEHIIENCKGEYKHECRYVYSSYTGYTGYNTSYPSYNRGYGKGSSRSFDDDIDVTTHIYPHTTSKYSKKSNKQLASSKIGKAKPKEDKTNNKPKSNLALPAVASGYWPKFADKEKKINATDVYVDMSVMIKACYESGGTKVASYDLISKSLMAMKKYKDVAFDPVALKSIYGEVLFDLRKYKYKKK